METNKPKTLELIKKLYPELPARDLERFLHIIEKTGLDPIRNQIYVVPRNTKKDGKWIKTWTIQTSIDGFRVIAERTGKYSPSKQPELQYSEDKKITGAIAYLKKMTTDGTWHEVAAIAYWEEYVQLDKDKKLTTFWKKMPRLMIAKCAEALALRKAFPDALSGLYTDDEMGQANNADKEDKEDIQFINPTQFDKLQGIIKPLSIEKYNILLNSLKINSLKEVPENKYKNAVTFLNNFVNKHSIKGEN